VDWILDHLQIVIAIAAAVAYWLNQARKGASGGEETDNTPTFPAPRAEESEEAERARRIREEIRRKIAERARNVPTRSLEPAPPPLFGDDTMAPRPMAMPLAPDPRPAPRNDWQAAAVLEQQRKLREQMEALEQARRAESAAMAMPAMNLVPTTVPNPVGLAMREDLKSKAGLRRAIILREVLGPPVALR